MSMTDGGSDHNTGQKIFVKFRFNYLENPYSIIAFYDSPDSKYFDSVLSRSGTGSDGNVSSN